MVDQPHLILASESPRRLALLEQIGVVPARVQPAEIDEIPNKRELPRDYVKRLAKQKAEMVASRHRSIRPHPYILAADTIVACGRRILPKPIDVETARQCLDMLSGRSHMVFTGVALVDAQANLHFRLAETRVKFKRLSHQELSGYLESGEWQGKAGGYAIQGKAAIFIRSVSGSYSNVVGLPLFDVAQLLSGCGYPLFGKHD